jgi:UDP-2,3-diacylglucosamine pyrophosphatase LpxH
MRAIDDSLMAKSKLSPVLLNKNTNVSFKGSWVDYTSKDDKPEKLIRDVYQKTQNTINQESQNKGEKINWKRITGSDKFTRKTTIQDTDGNSYIVELGKRNGITYTGIYKKNPTGFENMIKDKDGFLYSTESAKSKGQDIVDKILKEYTFNKTCLFVSDLHMGKGDKLDDFAYDKEFAGLLKTQSKKHMTDNVNLVILGDMIDIWSLFDEKDPKSKTADKIKLDFPVKDRNEAVVVNKINDYITEVFEKHNQVATAIQDFLNEGLGNRKLVYVIGNHDHAVVNDEIKEHVKQQILGENYDKLKDKLEIRSNYDNKELGIYGEHGNQYHKECSYDNFDDFKDESTGYYFVQLLWNPLKYNCPKLEGKVGVDTGLKILENEGSLAFKCMNRLFRAEGIPENRKIISSRDDKVTQINKLKKFIIDYKKANEHDELIAEDMFKDQGPNLRKGKLDSDKYKFVVLGHTHRVKDENLSNGAKFYNTGSWRKSKDKDHAVKLPYVEISKNDENETINSGLKFLEA